MGAFFIYILKSAVCLVLFYLFFKVLLSKETFHRFNRVALLGVLLLSLLIPCIEVTTKHHVEVQQAVLSIEQLLMMAQMEAAAPPAEIGDAVQVADSSTSISWVQIVLLVYLAGIVILACRNIYSLLCLLRLIYSGKREKMKQGVTLVVHNREIAPFSWMKYIVINQKDLEENGREILIHEMAHVRNRHSVDLLVADICIFFQWFNPGAWLLKQELQNIHEYEADETVINKGVNAKEYQLLLIKKAVGTRLYSMANSFNHSKLKKRITMMLKEKSNPWARLKYLYVLPLAAVAVTAFARPEISEKAEEISAVKVNDLAEFMQVNVPRDTVKVKHGTVNTMQTVKRGVNEVTTNEAKGNEEMVVFDVVEKMPEFPGGLSALNKYLEDKVNSSSLKGKTGGSVIVEFTVSENGKVKDVKATQSDHSDLTKEAEKIVSEMPDWAPGQQRGMSVPVKYSVPVRFGNIRFTEGKKPLVLVDGKEVEHDALEKMNQDVIESFTILKDSSAVAVYGSRGADGVILIKTKEQDKTKSTEAVTVVVTKDGSRTEVSTNIKVKGTVVDEQGRPKRGVSVVVANSSTGTLTDADGRFHLNAPQDGILWFSFVGYKTVKVPASTDMSIRMEQEVVKLFPEKTGTFKITTRASGVEGPSGINIHGTKDEKPPLVIIDGKEATEPDALEKVPNDRVKGFSILKDDAATKMYGDKGKNGVIIVDFYTDEEYKFREARHEKPYVDALEMVESMTKGLKGKIVYSLDDKEISKKKLKGISTKTIRTISLESFEDKKLVRLQTEGFQSDWIPISGVVKDTAGNPVVAYVTVKGTNDIVKSNSKGAFTMRAPKKGILLVRDNVKPTLEVDVNGRSVHEIVLKD